MTFRRISSLSPRCNAAFVEPHGYWYVPSPKVKTIRVVPCLPLARYLPDASRRFQTLPDAFQTLPDASRRFQTLSGRVHDLPDASRRFQTLPDASRRTFQTHLPDAPSRRTFQTHLPDAFQTHLPDAPSRRTFQTHLPAFKLLSGISVENFFCLINLTHFVGWTIFSSFCLLFVAILSLSEFPGALELFWGFL